MNICCVSGLPLAWIVEASIDRIWVLTVLATSGIAAVVVENSGKEEKKSWIVDDGEG
jgi:hypothetical protein